MDKKREAVKWGTKGESDGIENKTYKAPSMISDGCLIEAKPRFNALNEVRA